MKILSLIPTLSSGGAERVLSNLANDWCAHPDWQVRVVTLAGDTRPFYPLDPRIGLHPLNLHGATANAWASLLANWRRLLAVRREIARFQPDLVIGFMSQANVLIALACLGTGIPTLGSEHTHPPKIPLGRAWELLRRYAYGWLGGVIALTAESKEWLLKNTQARRCWVIPNAVPYPIPAQESFLSSLRAKHPGKMRILAAGRLTRPKGFDLLIKAFSQLGSLHTQWELVILGEGEQKEGLMSLCIELGVEASVSFPGVVGNIGEWYASADLFVLSSRYEGFGNVLAEALAYGVPCISFDCPYGPRHIIRHGIDGLLVQAEDIDALASAMAQLMSNDAMRTDMASQAVAARDRFSLERVHGHWNDVLTELTRPKLSFQSGIRP